MARKYEIRFNMGIDMDAAFESMKKYSCYEINEDDYNQLMHQVFIQKYLLKIEKSYDHIINDYRDFESNNFSMFIDIVLPNSSSSHRFRDNYSFQKHLLNLLTSTYLYTQILKINCKDENSKDIYDFKNSFKLEVNNYHETRYQYTFMSELRNKLNHGGSLLGELSKSTYWSTYWDDVQSKKLGFRVMDTDQRFAEIDFKILKYESEEIIDNPKYFKSVEKSIPDEFYLRETIRIYIDLLSNAHAELRKNYKHLVDSTDVLIKESLSKEQDSVEASLLVYEGGTIEKEINIYSSKVALTEIMNVNKAPLGLEFFAGMPGEYREKSVSDKPTRRK